MMPSVQYLFSYAVLFVLQLWENNRLFDSHKKKQLHTHPANAGPCKYHSQTLFLGNPQ